MASYRAHRILNQILKNNGDMSIDAISEIVEGFEFEADCLLRSAVITEEEGMMSPAETQGTLSDPTLDPGLEKEYFMKTIEVGDHVITLKTIGIGRNKPVSVYIDGYRWEMFPGPIKAEKETVAFIKSDHFDKWLERFSTPAPEEDPADETDSSPSPDTEEGEAERPTEVDGEKDSGNGSSEDEEK
jgi:hypothetical protein